MILLQGCIYIYIYIYIWAGRNAKMPNLKALTHRLHIFITLKQIRASKTKTHNNKMSKLRSPIINARYFLEITSYGKCKSHQKVISTNHPHPPKKKPRLHAE